MRTKHQILDDSQRVMDQLPKEGRLLVHHEVLFLEVWIDIRDQAIFIKRALQSLDNHLVKSR